MTTDDDMFAMLSEPAGNSTEDRDGVLVGGTKEAQQQSASIAMGMPSSMAEDYDASAQQGGNQNQMSSNNATTASTDAIALGMDTAANPYEAPATDAPSGDFFAGLGSNNNEQKDSETNNNNNDNNNNNEDISGNDSNADERKDNVDKTDDEPTFLSVWLEQRMKELKQRRIDENESKNKLLTEAQEALEQFHADRSARIAAKQKENRLKENQLREDLQSTFQHGTIWEQVGKMVNLQEKANTKESDRMRVLLIHLKNSQQAKANSN